jgi:hypothetical protein
VIDSKRERSAVLSFASPNGLREPKASPDILDRATLLGHYIFVSGQTGQSVVTIRASLVINRTLDIELIR